MRAAVPGLALALLAGCLQGEQAVTIFPDGSGKVTFQLAIKRSVLNLAKERARRSGEAFDDPIRKLSDPAVLARIGEGVAAWRIEPLRDDPEWSRVSVTAWFEDINRVRILDWDGTVGEDGQPDTIFRGKITPGEGGGGSLTLIAHASDFEDIEEAREEMKRDEAARATLDTMKPLLAELRFASRVTVPGPILSARGFLAPSGRSAELRVDGQGVYALIASPNHPDSRRLEEMMRSPGAIVWGEPSVSAEEIQAFRRELEAAKAAWGGRGAAAASPSAPPSAPRSLGAEADQLTDDEVDRLFIDAQLKVAREQISKGQKDKARATLQGVLKDFPKAKASLEAKKLLDTLK